MIKLRTITAAIPNMTRNTSVMFENIASENKGLIKRLLAVSLLGVYSIPSFIFANKYILIRHKYT